MLFIRNSTVILTYFRNESGISLKHIRITVYNPYEQSRTSVTAEDFFSPFCIEINPASYIGRVLESQFVQKMRNALILEKADKLPKIGSLSLIQGFDSYEMFSEFLVQRCGVLLQIEHFKKRIIQIFQ